MVVQTHGEKLVELTGCHSCARNKEQFWLVPYLAELILVGTIPCRIQSEVIMMG
jgi:hypothetical protein